MRKHFDDIDLNRSVGNLLRIGVIISVSISIVGFIKLFIEGFTMPKHYKDLTFTNSEKIFSEFWRSFSNFEGVGLIQCGILLLIFTPVMRIIFALIGYTKERDMTYVLISLIVLAIILLSFFTGFG